MRAFDHGFEVDGKSYTLRYNFAVRRVFEKKFGKTVPLLLQELATPETHTAENLLLTYQMLLSACHPDMTEDQIGELIDVMGEDRAVSEVAAAVGDGSGP